MHDRLRLVLVDLVEERSEDPPGLSQLVCANHEQLGAAGAVEEDALVVEDACASPGTQTQDTGLGVLYELVSWI